MKIAVQIATANMGDIVIEVAEEKNTTNVEQQKAVLVELLWDAVRKIKAVYEIPQEFLDIGDYESADQRHQKTLAEPKPSSAERNRQERLAGSSDHSQSQHTIAKSCSCDHAAEPDADEFDEEDNLDDITEDELSLAVALIRATREELK